MKYRITLQNKVYEVEVVKGEATLLAEYEAKAPAPAQTVASTATAVAVTPVAQTKVVESGAGKPVPCPLGGLVVEVKCKVGDTVKQNDVIFVVEAMKMENDISAPFAGKVVAINVQKGANVQAGDILIVLA